MNDYAPNASTSAILIPGKRRNRRSGIHRESDSFPAILPI